MASLAVEASNPQRRAPSPRSWRTRSCGGGERLSCLGLGKGCTCPRCRRFPPGPVALRRPLCLPGACWRAEVTVGSRPSFLSVARCASSVAPARHLQHAWPTPSRGEASIRCRGSTAAVGRVQRAGPCGLVRRRALGARWAGRAGMGGCTHHDGRTKRLHRGVALLLVTRRRTWEPVGVRTSSSAVANIIDRESRSQKYRSPANRTQVRIIMGFYY